MLPNFRPLFSVLLVQMLADTGKAAFERPPSQRHDNLAEMLVGFHVLERLVDVVEGKHFVDRQLQLSRFHGTPDVLPDLVKDLADLLDGAGAEGDADIVDAAGRMQVEIKVGMGAAEPADID